MPSPLTPFLRDFLGENPELVYRSFANRLNQSPFAQRFFQSQYTPIQNLFLGELGRQARGGQVPELQFVDFLEQFDFPGYFRQETLPQRLAAFSRLAPPVRYLF